MLDQPGKNFLDCCKVGIKIEMFLLDIQDERVLGMKQFQRAIALVPLGNEPFAARIPMGIRSQNRNLRADIMGWM